MNKNLQIGDVFVSRVFAHLTKSTDENNKRLIVGGSTDVYVYENNVLVKKDVLANDPSRGTAKFVVVHAYKGGGGYGHGPNDYFPDGWQVVARRLNDDGTYNEAGEEVGFSQCSHFNNELKDFTVVGKMRPTFV